MKNILNFINEALENSSRFFRFDLTMFDKDNTVKGIENVCGRAGIYCERTDEGIKIKISAVNVNKVSTVIEYLTDIANRYQNSTENTSAFDKLVSAINKMEDYVEELQDAE